jgi:hypothetical protein
MQCQRCDVRWCVLERSGNVDINLVISRPQVCTWALPQIKQRGIRCSTVLCKAAGQAGDGLQSRFVRI